MSEVPTTFCSVDMSFQALSLCRTQYIRPLHFLVLGIVFIFSCFVNIVGASGSPRCADFLTPISQSTDGPRSTSIVQGTESLIAYLAQLFDHQVITEEQLFRFISGLERGEMTNPISEEDGWVHIDASYQRSQIQEYMDRTQLNPIDLLEWAKSVLAHNEEVQFRRDETRAKTSDVYRKILFHRVSAGGFEIDPKWVEDESSKAVVLTYPFEMMSTPVTQLQWVEIMGENPSYFNDGIDSIVMNIMGPDRILRAVRLQPDHPVERVTWWSAVIFANILSERRGLKPVYDLSGVQWKKGTRAENGTLDVESGEIQINVPDGNYYRTEGFRLPTEAEQELIRRSASASLQGKPLKKHAWFQENSHGRTHPVADLDPLIVDGKDFYDLFGNVLEWGWDWESRYQAFGVDPAGSLSGIRRVRRGGHFKLESHFMEPSRRFAGLPRESFTTIGFRLARTVQ